MCDHKEFISSVIVFPGKEKDGEVIGHVASIIINCKECTESFEFIGMPTIYVVHNSEITRPVNVYGHPNCIVPIFCSKPNSETKCKHELFAASVKVFRLTDNEDKDTITGYATDIKIRCQVCMEDFQFAGVPGGVNPNYPTVSADLIELRAPIRPWIHKPKQSPPPNNSHS